MPEMTKSEYALMQVTRYLGQAEEPVNLSDLIDRAGFLTDDGDPRWIAAALLRLNQKGWLSYLVPGCDDNHDHNDKCTVELITQ